MRPPEYDSTALPMRARKPGAYSTPSVEVKQRFFEAYVRASLPITREQEEWLLAYGESLVGADTARRSIDRLVEQGDLYD